MEQGFSTVIRYRAFSNRFAPLFGARVALTIRAMTLVSIAVKRRKFKILTVAFGLFSG